MLAKEYMTATGQSFLPASKSDVTSIEDNNSVIQSKYIDFSHDVTNVRRDDKGKSKGQKSPS